MIAKLFSLTSSEFFLRGSKFLFFLVLVNFYSENIVYEYGYFTALFSILFVFSDMGYQTFLTKELSHNNSSSIYTRSTNITFFRVIIYILISSFFLIYYFFTDKEIYIFIFFLFLSDSIMAMSLVFYRSKENHRKETNLKIIIGLIFISSSCMALFILNIYIVLSFLTSALLIFVTYEASFINLKNLKNFINTLSFKNYFKSIQKSFYIFGGSLATIAYLRLDILMLEWFSLKEGVVLYTIASRVLELSLIVPAMISVILLPRLVKIEKLNITKDILIQFTIGIFVMILFLMISTILISILFPKYTQTIIILDILLVSIPFMLISNYGFTFFIAKTLSKFYLFIPCTMLLLNFILNYITIPMYGYNAAAWTTLITECIGTIIILFYVLKYKKM